MSFFSDLAAVLSVSTLEAAVPCSSSSPKGCLFADILQGFDVGVIVTEPAKHAIVFYNPTAQNVLKLAPEALESYENLEHFLHPGQNGGRFGELTTVARSVHFKSRILGYSTYPVSKTYLCFLIRDITEKVRLESIAQTVNTMDNIGMIFSGIRHEMGNPLNSIKMTMSVLEKNVEYFSRETIMKYIGRVTTEVARMEYLLKSLRNFSMFENLENVPVDLLKFLNQFNDLIRRDFERRGIHLHFNLLIENQHIRADVRALNQVLLNLLSNAADSLEGRDNPRITVSARAEEHLVILEIEDNGCGMSEEQLRYLFRPFYTNKERGNGLGLIITQKLLTQMDASIAFHSVEEVGTRIEITFPATDSPEAQPSHEQGAT